MQKWAAHAYIQRIGAFPIHNSGSDRGGNETTDGDGGVSVSFDIVYVAVASSPEVLTDFLVTDERECLLPCLTISAETIASHEQAQITRN